MRLRDGHVPAERDVEASPVVHHGALFPTRSVTSREQMKTSNDPFLTRSLDARWSEEENDDPREQPLAVAAAATLLRNRLHKKKNQESQPMSNCFS